MALILLPFRDLILCSLSFVFLDGFEQGHCKGKVLILLSFTKVKFLALKDIENLCFGFGLVASHFCFMRLVAMLIVPLCF